MSRIWGLEELVAKGKITEKQAEKIMQEFIERARKAEEGEIPLRIYEGVTEETLKYYLKDDIKEEIDFFDENTAVCKNCGHLIRRRFDLYHLWHHFTRYYKPDDETFTTEECQAPDCDCVKPEPDDTIKPKK